VIEHIGKIPWLKICHLCAARLPVTEHHPSLEIEQLAGRPHRTWNRGA
jgi:hypothetical protein